MFRALSLPYIYPSISVSVCLLDLGWVIANPLRLFAEDFKDLSTGEAADKQPNDVALSLPLTDASPSNRTTDVPLLPPLSFPTAITDVPAVTDPTHAPLLPPFRLSSTPLLPFGRNPRPLLLSPPFLPSARNPRPPPPSPSPPSPSAPHAPLLPLLSLTPPSLLPLLSLGRNPRPPPPSPSPLPAQPTPPSSLSFPSARNPRPSLPLLPTASNPRPPPSRFPSARNRRPPPSPSFPLLPHSQASSLLSRPTLNPSSLLHLPSRPNFSRRMGREVSSPRGPSMSTWARPVSTAPMASLVHVARPCLHGPWPSLSMSHGPGPLCPVARPVSTAPMALSVHVARARLKAPMALFAHVARPVSTAPTALSVHVARPVSTAPMALYVHVARPLSTAPMATPSSFLPVAITPISTRPMEELEVLLRRVDWRGFFAAVLWRR
ncbi:hypothetical protein C7M84_012578 [Penaeus vannamei]|uniref:Uncharacterized protein n=1 Tax=Penaeus vannamei TaxID=6689 RepID=A0A3R7Q5P7_PENVA|nr:hypothetical protein C7M84_012578 [Penaeus vannamei]